MFRAIMTGFGFSVLAAAPGSVAATFSEDVAPIFYEHCASCHRPDHIAPMSLLSYEQARPWAKSIAKAVSTKQMPPFSGESDRHEWKNDISLTQEEIDTILAWVQQGVKEGNPANLPQQPTFPEGWVLGEPDYVITLDQIDIPASGEDLFPKQSVAIDIDEPQWINAIEFMPGDRRAAHHTQLLYSSPRGGSGTIGSTDAPSSGVLAIWTAGMPPFEFPEGMGRLIRPGTRVIADSHYHPFGEATKDVTRVGLYFGDGELKKEVATYVVVNTGLRIPPHAANHAELAYHVFDHDSKILALSPHLHVRGKAMKYVMNYPDGRSETLLDVPKYNYNWQWQYYPTEPIDAPKGSRLEVTAVWDNSEANPANPDPRKEIIYRGDTFNEMFVGFMEAIPADGVFHDPTPPKEKIMQLLSEFPADESFFVGGFLPFGFYAPKEPGKEGWLYLVQGGSMFTISLDDFAWDGNRLKVTTQFPTPEASATTTILEGELEDDGRLKGDFIYGLDSEKPMELPLIAQPMTILKS